ncbi:23S rRNA (guanosine(2251)-2'-O)-methyltransferase RlmB [Fibrella sp. HMF5335]|uniref:23S rRNA (Guanosine(2251)-2'-O)-methyltransferase RlmB n=1 Tax=Fibrella rubiginis TaxID=2817060 RepID=A0A939GGU3_9BACT|nr:23S rRNA (guanosine(2251)-2'-O)-methyltransferase RlmB [Fibrella rubiginis]MBO0936516.1 23S rRNA (guanosine(2251)-2'-O)-methyltransferase RlmB [Fibrella rubiginis]
MENRRNTRLNKPTTRPDDSSSDEADARRPRDFTRSEADQPDADRSGLPVGRSRPSVRQEADEPRPRPEADDAARPERRPYNNDRPKRPQSGSDRRDQPRSGGYSSDRPGPKKPYNARPGQDRNDRPKREYHPKDENSTGPSSEEMVYGIQSVIETLKSDQQIDKLYMEIGLSNPDIQNLAFQNRVTIQRVPVDKLNRLTRKNHQGVVCLVAAVTYVKLSNVMADVHERGETPFLLLLDRITDVRNFGAIARTAECAGVQCIVIPGKGSAAINSDAMKTSSGALNHISVCREFDLVDTIAFLQKSGVQVVACTEKSHRDLYTLNNDLTGPLAIVMGSEEDGISPEILRAVDGHIKIPLLGTVGSLNVSVATGVMLYEVVRQRSVN